MQGLDNTKAENHYGNNQNYQEVNKKSENRLTYKEIHKVIKESISEYFKLLSFLPRFYRWIAYYVLTGWILFFLIIILIVPTLTFLGILILPLYFIVLVADS